MAARVLRESGRPREAERYDTRAMAHEARAQQQDAHRVFLMPDDNYAAHGLTKKELELCRATFRRLPRVGDVHAVRKILPGAGEPHLVFLVTPRPSLVGTLWATALSTVGVSPSEDTLAETVSEALRLSVPYTVFLDIYQDDAVVENVKKVASALIFDRHDR